MIYKPDWFNSQGNGERVFQNWLESILRGRGWHVQAFEDRRSVGIPDFSAAGVGLEVWAEIKVAKRLQTVHDYMHLEHNLTAQQHRWLADRQKAMGSAGRCGVVVSWRTGAGDNAGNLIKPIVSVQEYVSFVPIGEWRMWSNKHDLMAWALSNFTAHVPWLVAGECPPEMLFRGELHPGWMGRVVRATGAPIGVPEQLG